MGEMVGNGWVKRWGQMGEMVGNFSLLILIRTCSYLNKNL